jgi:hypothetical protein
MVHLLEALAKYEISLLEALEKHQEGVIILMALVMVIAWALSSIVESFKKKGE